MAAVSSPLNTSNERLDSLVLSTGPTGQLKRAVAGSSRTVTGGDANAAAEEVGTHVDDAAFTIATDTISVIGALIDETSTDSGDEGDAVAVRATADRILRVVSQQRSSTATKASVAGSASSVTILAANTARRGATITNDSTAILYLDLTGGTASTTSYTVQLAGSTTSGVSYFEVPFGYTGLITGIWASATGNARVTEFVA